MMQPKQADRISGVTAFAYTATGQLAPRPVRHFGM